MRQGIALYRVTSLAAANFNQATQTETESTKITQKHPKCGIQHSDLVID
jgi:hypothetical protein